MDQLDRGLRQHVNQRGAKDRTAVSFGAYGQADSSPKLVVAIAIIVLVVVVLVALLAAQQGAPGGDPGDVSQPAEGHAVTLVRPPAWIPAERLAAPSPPSW